jgi:Secretory lipase
MSMIDVARHATASLGHAGASLATASLGHATASLMMVSTPRLGKGAEAGFYEPPDPLPSDHPGEVIRAEPVHAYLAPGVRLRAQAWRILYHSTGALGEPTAVSGTVLVPTGFGPLSRRGRTDRPLVGYAIGTHGIGDAAAPSRLLPRGLEWEAGLMALLLARGWAVAVTDYQGLGTPGDHTYMVGRTLGRNVLDAMRAARALELAGLSDDAPAAIIGYSEGGAAAAWAAQLQPTYAPDVPLAAVSAGAAAADLEAATSKIDGSALFSFFIAYGGIGYAAAYPELDLDRYLTPAAKEGIERLRQSTVLQAAMAGPRFAKASELTTPNILELPEWRRRLVENRLGTIAPEAPVLLHHAPRDQIISFEQSTQLLSDWQALGADVRLYETRVGVDHVSGAVAGTPVAIDWLSRRLRRPLSVRPAGLTLSPTVAEARLAA